MAAIVQIYRKTGLAPGSGTIINGTNTRAVAKDGAASGGTGNPVFIPASGFNFSFWATTRLNCAVTPAGTIDNLRWFTDGTNGFGTGVTCVGAKASTGADAGYRQATGVEGTGLELTQANHSGLDEAPVNVFTFTAASPKALAGSISNPSTGQFGDHLVYQIRVDPTALPGATGQETFTWRRDET